MLPLIQFQQPLSSKSKGGVSHGGRLALRMPMEHAQGNPGSHGSGCPQMVFPALPYLQKGGH